MTETLESKTKKPTIIIADDSGSFLRSLKYFLKKKYKMDSVNNADELINRVHQNDYDLILTDNQMEDGRGNSGLYASKEIRDFNPHIPIILITADPSKDVINKAEEIGINKVLKKSICISELKGYILDLITSYRNLNIKVKGGK